MIPVSHPTIMKMQEIVASGDHSGFAELLAENARFQPPTYWKTWTGREPVAAVLGHVAHVFSDFRYRRVLGEGKDWILEFQCKVGDLDAVGVDLITLNDDGLIEEIEVAMRPYKTVGALRDAMNARVMTDARFLKYREALS
ncbi:nuclear transport factor 2 family protein [Primorskyibacter sp. S87]|uniref:nuclear transport factor 2 family protein n=1 Tax=Primorskyibacter sp. S87 TaxID=3415126 RepID=UPI003C79B518